MHANLASANAVSKLGWMAFRAFSAERPSWRQGPKNHANRSSSTVRWRRSFARPCISRANSHPPSPPRPGRYGQAIEKLLHLAVGLDHGCGVSQRRGLLALLGSKGEDRPLRHSVGDAVIPMRRLRPVDVAAPGMDSRPRQSSIDGSATVGPAKGARLAAWSASATTCRGAR